MEIKVKKTFTLILDQEEARLMDTLLIHKCVRDIHNGCPFAQHHPGCEKDEKGHPVCYRMGEALNKALEG